MTLPKITNQQQAIIRLLYRQRFLDRKHIQVLLNHKDKRRIIAWLKDLRDKEYITWIYGPENLIEKNKPAIHYLGINGVRYLRSLSDQTYPADELRKRYKESTRTRSYIEHCLMLADCCVGLQASSAEKPGVSYEYVLESDYLNPESPYHHLAELRPSLFFTKQAKTKDGIQITNYLLEVFDASTPRYMVKKRLKDYVEYITYGGWEQLDDDIDITEPPIVLFICPTTADLIYAKRRLRKLFDDEDYEDIQARVTLRERVAQTGIVGEIWEEV